MELEVNRWGWWVLMALISVGFNWLCLKQLLSRRQEEITRSMLKRWVLSSLLAVGVYALLSPKCETYVGLGWLLLLLGIVNLGSYFAYGFKRSEESATDPDERTQVLDGNRLFLLILTAIAITGWPLVAAKAVNTSAFRRHLEQLNSRTEPNQKVLMVKKAFRQSDEYRGTWTIHCFFDDAIYRIECHQGRKHFFKSIMRSRARCKTTRNLVLVTIGRTEVVDGKKVIWLSNLEPMK